MTRATKHAVAAATALGVLVTLLALPLSGVPVAFDRPVLRVVLDTVVALIALLLAFLVYGRHLLHRRLADLVLVFALGFAGVVNALFAVAPQLSSTLGARTLAVLAWGPLLGRLLIAICFTVAAWTPRDRQVFVTRPGRLVVGGCLLGAMVLGLAVLLLLPVLPTSASPDLAPSELVLTTTVDQAILRAVRLVAMTFYLLAAVGFARRRNDPLAPALAASMVLSAFARLNLAAVPSLYPQLVYVGDVLRLLAYGVLLVAVTGEIRRYWRDQSTAAEQEDRRRVARALHDGVAQEINLVATQTRLWADGRPAMEPRLLAGAAERALDESRAAIHALTGSLDEPLHLAVLRVADDLEGRLGVRIRTDVEPVRPVSRDVRDAVVRAAREALVNAVRHGGAAQVTMSLREQVSVHLVVEDDGCGFDPVDVREGYGLDAVRARLAAVDGRLRLESAPGLGTTVDVEVP